MTQYKVFALVGVGALLIAESSIRPSNDHAGGDASAIAKPDTALDRFAVVADVAGAKLQWTAGIASRIEQEEYRVSQSARGLQAPNRAHDLRTHFGRGGIAVGPRKADEGDTAWQLTWRTTRWGRANHLVDIESRESEPRLEGERVAYAHAGIDEWYENRSEGLEQGFTIHERPSGDGPLIVVGDLGGGLRPQLSREEDAIDLLDDHGARVLRYGGLHAWDANGDDLPSHFELDGVEVALVIADDGATYPLTIDPLLTTPAWTGESNQAAAGFGTSVATAGDVNGDGFSDVIVGAWLYDNGESNEGRAFVYLGSALGLSLSPAWSAESNQANSAFGYSVATAGDVNGDGFSDVVVGAFKYDNGETDEGRAFVYHGSAAGLGLTPAWTAESDQASAAFGLSAATAGDVNGDGFSDVIVGALAYDNGETDEGRAFVYHGSAAGLGTTAVWTAESDQATSDFGATVATAGDVNGDGFSDVIVGASVYDNGESDEGRAFAYLGSASGLGATAAWTVESDQINGRLGNCVAPAGDVNGDGFSDVIVGVWQYDNVEPNEGRVYAYYGSAVGLATSPSWSAEANYTTARYGWSVATAGDVNGDGYADVIVGAYEYDNVEVNEGRAFVYHGSAAGLSTAIAWTAEPNQANARLGISVATAGDVNGDGFSDVIVGADQYDSGEINEGRAFVYLGSAGSFGPGAGWTAESNQVGAIFGYSVATAGDVNGDGFSDVIVGAYSYDNGQADEGRAFVYHGAASGLDTTPAWTAESNQAQALFGTSVASAGDVNGDGFSDVIVGASGFSSGENLEGRAFVYHGSAAGLGTTPAWIAEPNLAGAAFGASVATAGDVNGDGFSDVIVGAPQYAVTFSNGAAFVYHGSAAGLGIAPAWTPEENQPFDNFGESVGTAGDVNGDGFSDVIVGARSSSEGESGEGRASVYHGSTAGLATTPAWTTESNQTGAGFGSSVATAGDVNGDGFSDVIVGAYLYDNGENDEGRAFLYLGSAAGLAASATWTAESDQIDAQFGISVATAGDVNGDGFSDVIVGANRYDVIWTDDGRAFLYLGSPVGLDFAPVWRGASLQDGANFGWSVAMAGDVNGDGYSDVVVGALSYDNVESNEGRAFVSYGNEGPCRVTHPRQLRADGVVPIAQLGRSSSATEFRIRANMLSIYGRTRLQAEHEIKPRGVLFNGSNTILGSVSDIGSDGELDIIRTVSGLTADTQYHWRMRAKYDLVKTPFQRNGPWVHMPLNGWNEADLRTALASTSVASAPPAAASVQLEPFAPNPFSTITELAYTLPARGGVRLAVYDVSGREVVVIADELQDAGRHTTTWNGRSAGGRALPSGVYFTRLEFGGRVEARKLVLAR